ncbi:MAG TPA: serine hydrolase [Terriglobales bacterium]|nr:serine hydrolase [Terriglobales bacterium]
MRNLATIWLLLATFAAPAAAQSRPARPQASSTLQARVEAIARAHRGKVALFAKQLRTGQTVELNADVPVQTASVIKLPIMLEAFVQRKEGKLSFYKQLTLREEDKVGGSGVLTFMRPGLQLTLEDAIVLMMDLSDNTATNMVIDQVSIPAVNARLERIALKNTYLYKKVYKPAEGPVPADQPKFGLGKTTAREMATVLEVIERCDLHDPDFCKRMIDIMRNQQFRYMVPRYLERTDTSESASSIADKIGELDDVRNDVALVYTQNGPIVISAFTWDNKDTSWTPDNEAYITIARLAKAIVDAWAPAGLHKATK